MNWFFITVRQKTHGHSTHQTSRALRQGGPKPLPRTVQSQESSTSGPPVHFIQPSLWHPN